MPRRDGKWEVYLLVSFKMRMWSFLLEPFDLGSFSDNLESLTRYFHGESFFLLRSLPIYCAVGTFLIKEPIYVCSIDVLMIDMPVYWPEEFGSFRGNLDETHHASWISYFWLCLELYSGSSWPFITSVRIGSESFDMESLLFLFSFFLKKHSFILGTFSGFCQVWLCHYFTSAPF